MLTKRCVVKTPRGIVYINSPTCSVNNCVELKRKTDLHLKQRITRLICTPSSAAVFTADESPQLFYVYPEGNWVEVAFDSPYFMIGRSYYGKPILDRLLTNETSLSSAVALALLAFDATSTSVTDVGYPIDVAVLANERRLATLPPLLRQLICQRQSHTGIERWRIRFRRSQ